MNISEDLLIEISAKIKKSEIGKMINDIVLDGFSEEEQKHLLENTHIWSMLTSFATNGLEESILEDKFKRAVASYGESSTIVFDKS